MKNKKILALFTILVFIIGLVEIFSIAHAQQATTTSGKNVSSDLLLDLTLAQQNPAPDQKDIVGSETKQAVIIATDGTTTVIKPQDVFAPEAKTESQSDTINSEQTTSEQVITQPETVQVNENITPNPENNFNTPSTSGNLVPGTTLTEPDDNSAPADNSTNPNSPAPTASDNSSGQTTPDQQQPTTDQNNTQQETPTNNPPSDNSGNTPSPSNPQGGNSNDQQNIPLESQPEANPTSTGGDQTQQQDNSTSSQDSNSSGDNSSVQGASTGPSTNIFQQTIGNLWNFLLGK